MRNFIVVVMLLIGCAAWAAQPLGYYVRRSGDTMFGPLSAYIAPVITADAYAPNNSIYFSVTQNALAYKTILGTVEALY